MADTPPQPGTNSSKVGKLNQGAKALLPEIPYEKPPTDPRLLQAWYERFHEKWNKWRDEANQVIAGL